MLKRLQTTRATRNLRRDDLMTDYNSQMIAGQSVAACHPAPKRTLRSPYEPSPSSMGGASRSRSATSFRSDTGSMASISTGGRRSRPTSAKSTTSVADTTRSRPQSGKKNMHSNRPEWECGWWSDGLRNGWWLLHSVIFEHITHPRFATMFSDRSKCNDCCNQAGNMNRIGWWDIPGQIYAGYFWQRILMTWRCFRSVRGCQIINTKYGFMV